MSISESLLWVVLPYSSIAIFIMGVIWQYVDKENYGYSKAMTRLKNLFCIGAAALVVFTGLTSIFLLHVNLLDSVAGVFLLDFGILETTPFLFKMHMISLCVLLLVLPFTKYIKLVNVIFTKKFLVLPMLYLVLGV